jgi:hypothetical protein
MKKVLGQFALVAAMATGVHAADNFTSWQTKATITVDAASILGAPLSNYPVLVRLIGSSYIEASAFPNTGADVRFSSMDGETEYSYEIEQWVNGAGNLDTAIIWVRVPTVADDDITQIRLNLKNAAATISQSSGPDVFRPADGWLGVWHMTGGTTVTNTTPDATGSGRTGTLGTVGSQGQAIVDTMLIGVAKSFRGTNTTSTVATGGFFYDIDTTGGRLTGGDTVNGINTVHGPYTISAWVVPKQCHTTGRLTVISQYANINTDKLHGRSWALLTGENTGAPYRLSNDAANLATTTATTVGAEFKAEGTCTAGAPTYVSGTFATTTTPVAATVGSVTGQSMWLNGAVSGTANSVANVNGNSIAGQTADPAPYYNSRVYIARVDTGSDFRAMRGVLDEVRIKRTALNADWKKLDYETQRPSGNVTVVIGSPSNVLPSGKTMIQSAPVSARVAGSNVIFTVAEKSAGKLLVLDMQGRTVWSHDVSADSREIAWNSAGKGVFFARFSPKDANTSYLDTKFSLVK